MIVLHNAMKTVPYHRVQAVTRGVAKTYGKVVLKVRYDDGWDVGQIQNVMGFKPIQCMLHPDGRNLNACDGLSKTTNKFIQ